MADPCAPVPDLTVTEGGVKITVPIANLSNDEIYLAQLDNFNGEPHNHLAFDPFMPDFSLTYDAFKSEFDRRLSTAPVVVGNNANGPILEFQGVNSLTALLRCPLFTATMFEKGANVDSKICSAQLEPQLICSLLDESKRPAFVTRYNELVVSNARENTGALVYNKRAHINYLEMYTKVRDAPGRTLTPEFKNSMNPLNLIVFKTGGGCPFYKLAEITGGAWPPALSSMQMRYKSANEVCYLCGRCCFNHQHAPVGYGAGTIPGRSYSNALNPCGGRRELIARTWGVYTILMKAEAVKQLFDISSKSPDTLRYLNEAAVLADTLAADETVLEYISTVIGRSPAPRDMKHPPYILNRLVYKQTRQVQSILPAWHETVPDLKRELATLANERPRPVGQRLAVGMGAAAVLALRREPHTGTRKANAASSAVPETRTGKANAASKVSLKGPAGRAVAAARALVAERAGRAVAAARALVGERAGPAGRAVAAARALVGERAGPAGRAVAAARALVGERAGPAVAAERAGPAGRAVAAARAAPAVEAARAKVIAERTAANARRVALGKEQRRALAILAAKKNDHAFAPGAATKRKGGKKTRRTRRLKYSV